MPLTLFLLQLPSEPAQLRHWMYNLYAEKDALLEEFYRTGRFPYTRHGPGGNAPLELRHSGARFLALHLFFLASTAVFWAAGAWLRDRVWA